MPIRHLQIPLYVCFSIRALNFEAPIYRIVTPKKQRPLQGSKFQSVLLWVVEVFLMIEVELDLFDASLRDRIVQILNAHFSQNVNSFFGEVSL